MSSLFASVVWVKLGKYSKSIKQAGTLFTIYLFYFMFSVYYIYDPVVIQGFSSLGECSYVHKKVWGLTQQHCLLWH